MSFNPLEHPISFAYPARVATSAWIQHTPMAMLLVDLLRPSVLVELGTHYGISYCSFCQAVQQLAVECRCYAVDTWAGDEHAGLYGPGVLADLKQYHDPLYSSFSQLLQCTFDEACSKFADGSIDVLHIDGFHTYEAVRHDFDLWLPKMSERGVVLLHDIAEHHDDFGVWKVWQEIEASYPSHLALYHGHGLGIVAVGRDVPEEVRPLFDLPEAERAALRTLMGELGRRIETETELERLKAELLQRDARIKQLEHALLPPIVRRGIRKFVLPPGSGRDKIYKRVRRPASRARA